MGAPIGPGGIPLGTAQVEIDSIEIIVGHAVDVKEGRLPNALGEHYLQIVLVPQRRALLLPVTAPFLLALARQCERAAGMPQPQLDREG